MCRNLTQMEHADERSIAPERRRKNKTLNRNAALRSNRQVAARRAGVKAAEQATKAKIKASARIVAILPAS
jgi:hypothetical protein